MHMLARVVEAVTPFGDLSLDRSDLASHVQLIVDEFFLGGQCSLPLPCFLVAMNVLPVLTLLDFVPTKRSLSA
jgi:hypothetical protein